MTKRNQFLPVFGFLAAMVVQAVYYQVCMYSAKKATKQIYLACDGGVVVAVLNNGAMPAMLTDTGKPFTCKGEVNETSNI